MTPDREHEIERIGSSAHTLTPGQRIGSYTIVSSLGAGGMGQVYRAHDATLDRDVAVKVLPRIYTDDPDRLARFEREARVLAALNHPNIATIHGVERVRSASLVIQALVLELVEGDTLADRLVIARAGLPMSDALTIARQIAEALEAAHDKGIVHRDLKPANIKIRPDGVVKVLDFGLAKPSSDAARGPVGSHSPTMTIGGTDAGVLLGTAAYMSPEQARGLPVDKRADIWAFGCVLFEMCTGRTAFEADTVSDTISGILTRDWDRGALPSTTAPSIRRLLNRCLEKDSKRRLHDIADARLEIDDARMPEPAVSESPQRLPRHVVWSIAAAALVIGIATLGLLLARRDSRERIATAFEISTPTTRGDPNSFALSDDGRQLVYIAPSEGVSKLWLRELADTKARPLPGTDGAAYPFWAPDGRSIAFFANGKLKRVDLPDGAPRDLADAPSGRGGSWSSRNVILFCPSANSGLKRIPAGGGTATDVIAGGPGGGFPRWPQFLPNGRRFLYSLAAPGSSQIRGVYVASIDGGTPNRILDVDATAVYAPPDRLLTVRRGTLVAQRFDAATAVVSGDPTAVASRIQGIGGSAWRDAVAASSNGVIAYRVEPQQMWQIVWKDRHGEMVSSVAADAPIEGAGGTAAIAPDGRRIAYWVYAPRDANTDIWMLDVERKLSTRFTYDPGADRQPVWSPDGRRVAFYSQRDAVTRLFEKPADGSAAERLLVTGNIGFSLDWSPDGRALLYTTQRQAVPGSGPSHKDLWALYVDNTESPFAVAQTPFDETNGQFSPDGRWIAYQSNESNRFEIYLQRYPRPAGKLRVSTAGGTQPRWARDGHEIFYLAPNGTLMSTPVTLGSAPADVKIGVPATLFAAVPPGFGPSAAEADLVHQYSVTSDGQFMFFGDPAKPSQPSPITIVVDWDKDLPGR